MIVGETASVCALPAPVKPKRCFRSPLRPSLPFPWPALGLTFPIAFSIWAMKQQENTLWAVAGSGKMCRFLQRERELGKGGGRQGKVCRKNLNTTCIFHMTRQLFIIPLNPAVPPAPALAHPGKKIVDFAARRRRFMLLLLLSWLGMRCDRWLLRQLPCVAIPSPLPPPAGCSSCCCC